MHSGDNFIGTLYTSTRQYHKLLGAIGAALLGAFLQYVISYKPPVRKILEIQSSPSWTFDNLGEAVSKAVHAERPDHSLVLAQNLVINAGNTVIDSIDFDQPVSFKAPPNWKILAVTTPATGPTRFEVSWLVRDDNSATMAQCAINPEDAIYVNTLLEGPKNAWPEPLQWGGHIKGGQVVINNNPDNVTYITVSNSVYHTWMTVGYVIFFTWGYVLIYPLHNRKWIFGMVVGVAAAASGNAASLFHLLMTPNALYEGQRDRVLWSFVGNVLVFVGIAVWRLTRRKPALSPPKI